MIASFPRVFLALLCAGLLTLNACGSSDSPSPGGDPAPGEPSPASRELLENLKALTGKQVLVGHQATTLAGVGWRQWQKKDFSDLHQTCGRFPAMYGWELEPRPDEGSESIDYVSYDVMREEAVKAHARDGLNTYVLHPFRLDDGGNSWSNRPGLVSRLLPGGDLHTAYQRKLDKYQAELSQLRTPEGQPMPFILRPFHEADGEWFWWGSTACGDEEFKQLFRFTVGYLRQKGLSHMLVAYSPARFRTEEEYLHRYPGDDVVDILGFDQYLKNSDPQDDIGTEELGLGMWGNVPDSGEAASQKKPRLR
jgi:mannan endo-1,4-beta-mannosidase